MLNVSNYTFASTDYGLIGNCDIDDDKYSAMLVELRNLCLKENFYARAYNFIFQTLVEIAKRWKDSDEPGVAKEGRSFWRFMCKEIGVIQYYQNLYSQFTNVISEMGSQNQIPVVETGDKYYATLMMHAFAPKKSIYSFFDLCYNIFKTDLDFGFTSDDEWLCEIVALEIAGVFAGSADGKKVVSINSNSYWIKIGLRSFALHKGLFGNFVKFTKDIFFNINKLFNREIIEEETMLARYIAQWWENKTENEKVSDSTTRKRRIATVSKQNIVAKYIRDEGRVLLCVPPVRLDSEKETMCLAVYANGEQFCLEEMGTKRGEFVVSTKKKELDLNELLKHSNSINIQIKITENEAVIYDSKETLNREFILFDNEKEIFRQINKPSNYFVYSLNIDALEGVQKLENDDRLTTCGTNLYNIYPNAGEDLKGETKQVFFIDEAKVASLGTNVCLLGSTADAQWKLGDISCVVYKNAVKLMIPESFNLRALELRAYNKCHKLHELNYEHIELNCYQFELKALGILSECDPAKISLYSYEEEKTILSEILIVLPHLEMKFSSPFYYGDIERKITINSEDKTWNSQANEIMCPYNDGVLAMKVPYLKWRINNNEWRNEPIGKKVWYKDFLQNGDLLEIDSPKANEEIKLFVELDGKKQEISKNRSGKFEIGRAIYANEGIEGISVFCLNGNKSAMLFNIATKEHFIGNPLQCRNGKVFWNVEDTFVGDKNSELFLIITSKSKDNNLRTPIKNANQELELLYKDVLDVKVKLKDKNIFSKEGTWRIVYEKSKKTCVVRANGKTHTYNKKFKEIIQDRKAIAMK